MNYKLTGKVQFLPIERTGKSWQTNTDTYDSDGNIEAMRSDQISNFFAKVGFVPRWSKTKGRYLLPGLIKETTDERGVTQLDTTELDELVEILGFEARRGDSFETIVKCNPRAFNDRFINNPKTVATIGSNAAIFNCNIPLDKLKVSILYGYMSTETSPGKIAHKKSVAGTPLAMDANWYLSDTAKEKEDTIATINLKEEAFKKFTSLTPKLKKVYLTTLVAMTSGTGLTVADVWKSDDEAVKANLYSKFIDVDMEGVGKTNLESFLKLAGLEHSEAKVSIKSLIFNCVAAGVIRKRGEAYYNKNEERLAFTFEELVDTLLTPDNQGLVDSLESQLSVSTATN